MRHFLKPTDLKPSERLEVFARAKELKTKTTPPETTNKRVGALFFNPSLRTRVSFEQAAWLLGAHCQTLNVGQDSWKLEMDPKAVMDGDAAENIVEAARVLGRYFDVLGVRSFPGNGTWEQEKTEPILQAFAQYSKRPIISLEGAMHHPCQSLADHLTLTEYLGDNLCGMPVTLSWAWHPKPLPAAVPNSFALQMALAGADVTIAHPEGFDLDPDLIADMHVAAAVGRGNIHITNDRMAAMKKAKVVYVKSWGRLSHMHDPAKEQELRADLRNWILDDKALAETDNAWVMHCLPVRRNVVISSSVLDGPNSIVTDEAENRLWAQAALLEKVLSWS